MPMVPAAAVGGGPLWERAAAAPCGLRSPPARCDRGLRRALPSGEVRQCTAAISELGKRRQWQRAADLLDGMVRGALEPSLVTFNVATSAVQRGRCWEQAMSYYKVLCYVMVRHVKL